MKRLSTIIMALALVLGMSQCKKQETPTTGNTTPTNPGVHITVNVGDQDGKDGKDNNGEKHNIAPANGLFAFTKNDKLYVGHNGKYVGMLTFNGACFDGTIYPDATVTDQPLHFYFLGNAAISQSNDTIYDAENPKTSIGISIADQSENLPVLSYGASNELYAYGVNTTYSTTLKNKCALVKFNLANEGLVEDGYVVTLSGVPTLATVNFANPTAETAIVATEGQTNGKITLYSEDGVSTHRWAILLPGTNLSTGHNDLTITYSGNVNLGELGTNDYVNSGIQIANVEPSTYVVPTDAQKEYFVRTSANALTKFSVGDNKKVYFSRANLRAHYNNQSQLASWSFPESQYEDAEGPLKTNSAYAHQVGTVDVTGLSEGDRFTWGYGNYSQTSTDFYTENHDLSKENLTDWGCAFSEDSDEGDNWRTLSAAEWNYLFNNTSRGDYRYLRVQLSPYKSPNSAGATEPIHGIFVFPDHFNPADLDLDGTYSYNGTDVTGSTISGYRANRIIITQSEDAQKMLDAGAVFLPAVGYRNNGYYYKYYYYNGYTGSPYTNYNPQAYGYYWTSTHYDSDVTHQSDMKAYAVYFDNSCVKILDTYTENYLNVMYRSHGCCVRLVWDADPNN